MEYSKYILYFNDGSTQEMSVPLAVRNFAQFEFCSSFFQAFQYDEREKTIHCKEINEELYGCAHNTRQMKHERELIDFFKSKNIEFKVNELDEEKIKSSMVSILSEYFEFEFEVWGKHFSGRKVRIDAMLTPKDYTDWRNKNIRFGIEFKNPLMFETTGRRDTDVLAQCLDYSFSEFMNSQDLIVLLCPVLPSLKEGKLSRFLSRYNVGFVDFFDDTLCFKLGDQIFWDDQKGVRHVGKNSLLQKKYGNRGYKSK